MARLRFLWPLLQGAVIAALLVVIGALIATFTSITTGRVVEIPGLLLARAESGTAADLGSVQFASPGIIGWMLLLTAAASAAGVLTRRSSKRRQEIGPKSR